MAPVGGGVLQAVCSHLAPSLTLHRPCTHPGPRRQQSQHRPARRRGKRHHQPGRTDVLGSPPGLGTDGVRQPFPPDSFPQVTRATFHPPSVTDSGTFHVIIQTPHIRASQPWSYPASPNHTAPIAPSSAPPLLSSSASHSIPQVTSD